MAKALALTQIRKNAATFTRDWKDAPGDERQEAQSFVRDLLKVYGITATKAAFYEKRVKRSSTGRQGFIDALIPGLALIEMKSAGKDLVVAEEQALDYIANLTDAEAPRFVITSDFRSFRILDIEAEDDGVAEFGLDDFRDRADEFAFFAGYGLRKFGSKEQEKASVKAAKLMAGLYEALEGSGFDDHEASVFLVRTLFALYADDSGMWERDMFLEFLETRTAGDGSDLGQALSSLFQALGRKPENRMKHLDETMRRFPYVNGSIFEEPLAIPAFDQEMRGRLLNAAKFNWSEISPAIFGSLFQAVKDKTARRELGEHYTTETNIMKVIGPMFLDDLNQRFRDGVHDTKALTKLRADMGRMQFFDPACGCGNFLVVAYREMRSLDLKIALQLREIRNTSLGATADQLLFTEDELPLHPSNFHGLELEEWPARIAATALHLVEHQANQAMELALGQAPDSLPLNKINTITVGNALRTDWADVVPASAQLHILGNPPFLGDISRSEEQKEDLHAVWGRSDTGRLDYVTGWYAKALQLFRKPDYAGSFAFVSTNSITQGEPVPALFRPIFEDGWRIRFAHRTFAWTSEAPGAAAVHCVIVGFDKLKAPRVRLFEYDELRGDPRELAVTREINAYLIDGPNVIVEARREPLSPDLPPTFFGNKPTDGGNLIVERSDYNEVAADPVAAQYLRPYMMGRELLHNEPRWCLWMVDLDPADLRKSQVLRDRVKAVEQFRLASKAASTRKSAATPYLFTQRPHRDVPHLGVPVVSSSARRFVPAAHIGPQVIAGDKVYMAEDPDGLAFAVVSSSAFLAWQKAVGGRLKSDLSFRNTLTWNTFPLARLSDSEHQAAIAGGRAVLAARELHPGRSLADQYNPLAMDPALLRAHRELDTAIDGALGLRGVPDDDARLAALFKNYEKLIAEDQLVIPRAKGRKRRG